MASFLHRSAPEIGEKTVEEVRLRRFYSGTTIHIL